MSEIFAALGDIDTALEREGVPPLSPYWRAEAERFYAHLSALLLVEMVGRGGDKSRTSTKMAIAEVLAGDFTIPPGERHYFTHVSENRDEAAKTLGVLEQYLRILAVPFTRSGDTIELSQLPRGFKVLACRVGAVSGWRCIGWTADECAKWNSDGVDPSSEVIASIRAMTVTHPTARGRMLSSPLGEMGHFYETWSLGDTADQVVGHAASWEANQSITSERTHALERNERKWKREYAAIPAPDTDESMFSAALVDAAMRATPGDVPREKGVDYCAAIDPAFTTNAFTFVIAGKRWVNGRIKRSIVCAREWRGTSDKPLDPAVILAAIAGHCRQYGVRVVESDGYERFGLAAIAQRPEIGLYVHVRERNATERLARWEALEVQFADGEIELPNDRQVKADMLGVYRKLTPNGFAIRLRTDPTGRHSDYAPSISLALSQCVVDPAVTVKGPAYMSQEWEDARHAREIARLRKLPARGEIAFDEEPPWMEN